MYCETLKPYRSFNAARAASLELAKATGKAAQAVVLNDAWFVRVTVEHQQLLDTARQGYTLDEAAPSFSTFDRYDTTDEQMPWEGENEIIAPEDRAPRSFQQTELVTRTIECKTFEEAKVIARRRNGSVKGTSVTFRERQVVKDKV